MLPPSQVSDSQAQSPAAAPSPGRRSERTMLLVLLLAFALRSHHLDYQSFWSDEGISLLRGAQPLPELLAQMPTEHVPGYFLLLHAWLPLGGSHDFAVRFLSLWASVAAVALLYRLAVDLGRTARRGAWAPVIGLLASLLMATASFQVWYAQEARMYSWLLAAGLASFLSFWRLLEGVPARSPAAGVFLLYVLSTAASIYLHFYGFLVPLAQMVFAIGWLLATRDLRTFGRWVLAGLCIALLFLPWLPRAVGIFGFSGWREPGQPALIPWRYLAAYTAGDAMPSPWRSWLPPVYLALAGVGALAWLRIRSLAGFFVLNALLVPLALVLGLALRDPDFHERYAILLSAPLTLLAAGGIAACDARFWRAAPPTAAPPALPSLLLLGLLLLGNGLALERLYTDTALHKPDFRGAAEAIMAKEGLNDVVLVDGPDPEKVFLHYYRGRSPVIDLRMLLDASDAGVDAVLTGLTEGKEHAWELLYFRAPGPVQVWLATRAWAGEMEDYNDIRLVRYGLEGPTLTTAELGVPFGSALTLERAELPAEPLAPGDLLRVNTHWFTHAAAPEWKFSLRLTGADGAPVVAADYVPQFGFAPTNVWLVDRPAADRRGLHLPADLAPGRYTVTLRLYDPTSGTPVETPVGQDVRLGEVVVER